MNRFRLIIEPVETFPNTVTKTFASRKVMQQWKRRWCLESNLTILAHHEYTLNEKNEWERFEVIGKKIITLSRLKKIVERLEKEEVGLKK